MCVNFDAWLWAAQGHEIRAMPLHLNLQSTNCGKISVASLLNTHIGLQTRFQLPFWGASSTVPEIEPAWQGSQRLSQPGQCWHPWRHCQYRNFVSHLYIEMRSTAASRMHTCSLCASLAPG